MTTDVLLTPAQVRSLQFISEAHSDCTLVITPPIAGCIGVFAQEAEQYYLINEDGTPEPDLARAA